MYENRNKRRINIDLPSFNMPSFNRKNKKTLLNILSKLSLIAIFFFIFVFCISRFGKEVNKEINENEFNSNITYIQKHVTKYYNKNNIPQKKGDSTSMSLEELVDEKIVDKNKIDNFITCNQKNSYVSLTKTRDNMYSLKIYLNCDGIEEVKEVILKNI